MIRVMRSTYEEIRRLAQFLANDALRLRAVMRRQVFDQPRALVDNPGPWLIQVG